MCIELGSETDIVAFDHREPWERSEVTVCIAAACEWGAKIVLCSDEKVASELGSTKAYKQQTLPHKWICMGAGYEADIRSLSSKIVEQFRSVEKIDETNAVPLLERAIRLRKSEKASQYTSAKFGLSYDRFLDIGREKFPEEIFRATMLDIAGLSLRAEFVVCGFADQDAIICKTTQTGAVTIRENFAVCGEGETLATSVLFHRTQTNVSPFGETLYAVYEAKKYAERVPSVGRYTVLTAIQPTGRTLILVRKGQEWLESLYSKYGPKDIGEDHLQVPEDGLL
jgi:20S proteasome alpha/beta subunit